MTATSPTAGLGDELRHRVFGDFARLRARLGPIFFTALLAFLAFGLAPWRAALIGLGVLALMALVVTETRLARRAGEPPRWLRRAGVVVPIAMHVVLVFATGGLDSPFAFSIPVAAVLATLLVGPRRARLVLVLLYVPAVWAFAGAAIAGLEDPFGRVGGEGGEHAWYVVSALLLTGLMFMLHALSARVVRSFEDVTRRLVLEREDKLALHAEQTRALSALTAEIAHELKNPLASVKGLAALVARDATGKAADRIEVLRREVDRMQSVLEGLLDFSRPLVPLTQSEVDLAPLCAEVLTLHEGVVAARRLVPRLDCEGATGVRGDLRKLRQVLVNLVINAVEASPDGGALELRVDGHDPERVLVSVRDEGGGIPPEIARRVFEPGVTGKREGSGIGLTVARSLARQHGGEVSLSPGSPRGTLALLELPRVAKVPS